ncbi:hypothetical protein [Fodinicola acaciae]|uniref:hypothetical protein n=1 Tax=Fodinicola acaciae TaxID=2681555 RepID=UPI001C9E9F8B|nr:hypothetical protein [Fodinicola acaciae]
MPDRRDLFRMAGLGAAATVLPEALAGTASPATAAPAAADLPLIGGPEFPIGIFWPPPPYETTASRYAEIAAAGFTFVVSGNYADDGYIIGRLLSLADQAGLKVLVSDDTQVRNMTRWFTISDDHSVPMSITTADARELFKRALDAYGPHPSLAGFNLFDEPWTGIFPSLGKAFDIARSMAPQLLPYANLLPGNGPSYDAYVNGYIAALKPPLLSFDRYPLLTSGEDPGYFQNWAQIRAAGLAHGLPTWTYIQTLAYNGHRVPTAAELLWQVNVSLAYGAKGIQYFTYWTPDPARGEGFEPALITVDGHRTDRYAAAKKINLDWLQPVGRQLKPLVSESVQHANEPALPVGTTGFTPDEHVAGVTGSAVVLGRFTESGSSRRHLLVANRSSANAAAAVVTLGSAVTGTQVFNPRQNRWQAAPAHELAVALQPGEAQLLRLLH